MGNETSIKIDLSKGESRKRIEKMMSDLSISNYHFKNGGLCIPKNSKYTLPERGLTGAEKSLIESFNLTPVRPVYA